MTLSRTILLIAGLALAPLALSSCKDDTPKVDQIVLSDLRLSSFSISSEEHKSLSTMPFSIRNFPTGHSEVFNQQPITFGWSLKKIKLHIKASDPVSKIEVAMGESSEFKEYDAKAVHDLSGSSKLNIRLNLKGGNKSFSHIYKVDIRQYKYNPLAVEWTAAAFLGTPSLGDRANRVFDLGGVKHLFALSTTGMRHYTLASSKGSWREQLDLMPAGSSEQIEQVEQGLSTFYGMDAKGFLYKLEEGQWTKLEQDQPAKALLGVLPARTPKEHDRLALLLAATQGEVQAGQDPLSRYAYGYYEAGRVVRSGYIAPTNFPLTNRTLVRSFSPTAGSRLHLVGVGAERTAWYTTNGKDWQMLSHCTVPGVKYATLVEWSNQFYSIETTNEGMQIWVSTDRGLSWNDAKEVALKGIEVGALARMPVVAWVDEAQEAFFLLQGVSAPSSSAKVWRGVPLKNEF